MRELLQRRNGPALRDTCIWFGLLAAAGIWGYAWWVSGWACIPFAIYAVLYASVSDSRWHESLHGTAFKSDWLNNALYEVASFMVLRESTPWRWSHLRHHSDTMVVGRDPEIHVMRPPDPLKLVGADMPKSTLLSTGMQMLVGSVALFIVSVATGELNGFSFGQVSIRSWWGLIYLITFGSLVGFVSFGWLLHNAPVSLLFTYAYVNPVVAVFLGWLLAGEVLNARIAVASAIIIGSVIVINYARQVSAKKEALQVVPQEIE